MELDVVVGHPVGMVPSVGVAVENRVVLGTVGAAEMELFAGIVDLDFVLALGHSSDLDVASNWGCMCPRMDREPGCVNAGNFHPQWHLLVLPLHGEWGMHRSDVLPMSKIHMP